MKVIDQELGGSRHSGALHARFFGVAPFRSDTCGVLMQLHVRVIRESVRQSCPIRLLCIGKLDEGGLRDTRATTKSDPELLTTGFYLRKPPTRQLTVRHRVVRIYILNLAHS